MLSAQAGPQILFRERHSEHHIFAREGILEIFNSPNEMKEFCGKAINLNFFHALEAPKIKPEFSIDDLDIPSTFELSSVAENDPTLEWADALNNEPWEDKSEASSYMDAVTIR